MFQAIANMLKNDVQGRDHIRASGTLIENGAQVPLRSRRGRPPRDRQGRHDGPTKGPARSDAGPIGRHRKSLVGVLNSDALQPPALPGVFYSAAPRPNHQPGPRHQTHQHEARRLRCIQSLERLGRKSIAPPCVLKRIPRLHKVAIEMVVDTGIKTFIEAAVVAFVPALVVAFVASVPRPIQRPRTNAVDEGNLVRVGVRNRIRQVVSLGGTVRVPDVAPGAVAFVVIVIGPVVFERFKPTGRELSRGFPNTHSYRGSSSCRWFRRHPNRPNCFRY